MKTARSIAALAVALAFLQLPPAAEAGKKGKASTAPTAPGTYTDWNGELDEVEIVETFSLGDYQRLVVGGFTTDGVELPGADDNAYGPVQEVLADVVPPLVEGLGETLSRLKVERGTGDAASGGALLIRGRVVEMDPGSRAARYWAGFGAGAARAKLEGEVVDAASGRVLLRFTQERRSGVGVGGGNYVNLMQRNLRAIGEDLGAGLERF